MSTLHDLGRCVALLSDRPRGESLSGFLDRIEPEQRALLLATGMITYHERGDPSCTADQATPRLTHEGLAAMSFFDELPASYDSSNSVNPVTALINRIAPYFGK